MELNYKSFGQGDPVVILHGLFGTLDNWQTIAKQLAKDYTVFIIDQRNHGKSPHVDEHNYELMADDLYEFLTDKWIYGAHIVGHSMGGKTAIQFALNYPEMVTSLTVVDIGINANEAGHQTIFDALFSLDLEQTTSRKEADITLKKLVPDFGVRQFLLKNLTRKKEGGFRWKMNLPVIHENYENILAGIEADGTFDNPTLFIKGGKSDYIEAEDWEGIQEVFPESTLATIEKAGHWVHAEAPKEFLQILRRFLSS